MARPRMPIPPDTDPGSLDATDALSRRLQTPPEVMPMTDSISVSQDASPLLYATSGFHASFTIQDAVSGELLWKIPFPSIPTVIQPVN